MKKKTILFVILVFLLSIFTFTSCDNAPKDDSQGTGGGCAVPWDPFFCEYTADKETYDLSDVTLTFSFGYLRDYDIYKYYKVYVLPELEGPINSMPDLSELPPIKFYLFFNSFGNKHYVKTIDNIASEEYRGRGNHVEDITVPEELFYNEYGLIRFMITDAEDAEAKSYGRHSFCGFYYHKEGETVRISNEDLAPEYKYQFSDKWSGHTGTFLQYSDLTQQDFCGYFTASRKERSDTSDLPVEFYFGRLYDEKEKSIPSIDIYIETENASGEKKRILAKTIDDYMTDKYLCKRTYDYYGRVREVIFNHYEIIYIPNNFFDQEKGRIDFRIYESGTQNVLAEITLYYIPSLTPSDILLVTSSR